MTYSKSARLMGTCCLAALVGVAAPAVAQTAPAAPAADAPAAPVADTTDGDIVVTATKRSERLQDVPVSVLALPSAVLERQNVRELQDLPALVPGLTISYGSQPANFSINLRGVGTFSNGIAVESDVAVVIDDIPFGFQAAAFTDLVDVASLEVLRGPQSTLFGKSAISGVLNVRTQAPTDEVSGRLTGLITDDGEWRLGGTVSGAISSTLRARVTASASKYRGSVFNTGGDRLNGSGAQTIRATFVWNPSKNFELTLSPYYNHSDVNGYVTPLRKLTPVNGTNLYYQGITSLPFSLVNPGVTPSQFNRTVSMDERAGGVSRLGGAMVKAAYTLDDDSPLGAATIQYIGSYSDWRMVDYQDVDATSYPVLLRYPATPAGIASGSRIDGWTTARSFTHELRMSSPGTGRFNYVFGLWQSTNELGRFLDRGPVVSAARFSAESTNSQIAAFGDLSFKVTPQLVLLGGLRVQNQRISYHLAKYDLTAPFAVNGDWGKTNSENAVTGKVGLQFYVTPDIMAYGTYSTGYKGQAYDLVSFFSATTAANQPVPSEKAKSFEIGLKTSLFDRLVNFNVSAFRTDFTGFQVSSTFTQPNGFFASILNSVGGLRSKGIEAELFTRPIGGFSVNAAFAYTDAKITDFPLGPCFSGQTVAQGCTTVTSSGGSTAKVQNLAGKRLSNSPEFKYNVGVNWIGGSQGDSFRPFIGADWRWQSKLNFSLNQDPLTVNPAYGVLNGRIGAEVGGLRVTAFANNLLNKHYAIGLGNTNGGFFDQNNVGAVGLTWTPARDSFRYFGLRMDAKF